MLKQNTMNSQQEILLSLDAEDLQQRYLRKVSTPTSPTENSLSPKDPRSPMGSRTRSFSDFNSAILPVNSLSAPQVRFFNLLILVDFLILDYSLFYRLISIPKVLEVMLAMPVHMPALKVFHQLQVMPLLSQKRNKRNKVFLLNSDSHQL